jgi:hypothetical protein
MGVGAWRRSCGGALGTHSSLLRRGLPTSCTVPRVLRKGARACCMSCRVASPCPMANRVASSTALEVWVAGSYTRATLPGRAAAGHHGTGSPCRVKGPVAASATAAASRSRSSASKSVDHRMRGGRSRKCTSLSRTHHLPLGSMASSSCPVNTVPRTRFCTCHAGPAGPTTSAYSAAGTNTRADPRGTMPCSAAAAFPGPAFRLRCMWALFVQVPNSREGTPISTRLFPSSCSCCCHG